MKLVKRIDLGRRFLNVYLTSGEKVSIKSERNIDVMLLERDIKGFAWSSLVSDESNSRLENDLVVIEHEECSPCEIRVSKVVRPRLRK